jgi:hypothetical protein
MGYVLFVGDLVLDNMFDINEHNCLLLAWSMELNMRLELKAQLNQTMDCPLPILPLKIFMELCTELRTVS